MAAQLQQNHPIFFDETSAFAKERFELANAYVLGHLNGDEAIEGADNITVVLQIERYTRTIGAATRDGGWCQPLVGGRLSGRRASLPGEFTGSATD